MVQGFVCRGVVSGCLQWLMSDMELALAAPVGQVAEEYMGFFGSQCVAEEAGS